MNNIPSDIILMIYNNLHLLDIYNLNIVNKYFYDIFRMNKKYIIKNSTNEIIDLYNDSIIYDIRKSYHDNDFIDDHISQSVAPILSTLDPNRVKNCKQCLSLNGPMPGHNGWGNSIPIQNPSLTPAQDLIDIDSILSNRNVKSTKAKRGMVNDIDVFQFKKYDAEICDRGLDTLSSLLTFRE